MRCKYHCSPQALHSLVCIAVVKGGTQSDLNCPVRPNALLHEMQEPSWFGRSGKSRGPRPEETAPSAGHGNTGEYAVVRYHAVVLTPFMFMVCAIILLYEFGLNDWKAESWSDNPSFGPSTATLIDAGAKRTDLIVEDGDWWRLVAREFVLQHSEACRFSCVFLGKPKHIYIHKHIYSALLYIYFTLICATGALISIFSSRGVHANFCV